MQSNEYFMLIFKVKSLSWIQCKCHTALYVFTDSIKVVHFYKTLNTTSASGMTWAEYKGTDYWAQAFIFNPYIFARFCQRLKYQKFTTSGCKDVVANNLLKGRVFSLLQGVNLNNRIFLGKTSHPTLEAAWSEPVQSSLDYQM